MNLSLANAKNRWSYLLIFGATGVFQLLDAVKEPGNTGKALIGAAMIALGAVSFVAPSAHAAGDFADVAQARRSVSIVRVVLSLFGMTGLVLQFWVK